MSYPAQSGQFTLGHRSVHRLGYGAMQLAGPGVFGPPKDRAAAVAVLRAAVAQGVNHIDTSDFYGPHVTNQIIREALHPYAEDLVIVTKISARRGPDGAWLPAFSRAELTQAVEDNLCTLGLDVLEARARELGMVRPGETPYAVRGIKHPSPPPRANGDGESGVWGFISGLLG